MAGDRLGAPVTRTRDGIAWRIGTATDVDWISSGTAHVGRAIASAIPPVFAAYATVVLPTPEDWLDAPAQEVEWVGYIKEWEQTARPRHDRALLNVLVDQSVDQPWWLGYLDTGADDIVFPDVPKVTLYSDWRYVLVEAGPQQAATWRQSDARTFWKGALPNLMFPADRSWLVSTLWDDDWTSVGGAEELISALLSDPLLGARSRRVNIEEDATPPGHQAH
jgi:hypothetical protein